MAIRPLDLIQGTFAVYNAAMNASTLNLTPAEGALRAYAYAEAFLTSSSSTAPAAQGSSLAPCRPGHTSKASARQKGVAALSACRTSATTSRSASRTLRLSSSRCTLPSAPPTATPLTDSPLASDPRVNLDPKIHPDKQFDPLTEER